MVSHKTFRIIGYCYAVFVIAFTLVDSKEMMIYIQNDGSYHIVLSIPLILNLFLLIFYSILVIGIWKNKVSMVKTFRVFFHFFFGIVMSFLGILILIFTVQIMFYDGKFSSVMAFLFWCSLASCICFWLLTLWIIHGVIEAIQFELETSKSVMNQPNEIHKQFLSSSV